MIHFLVDTPPTGLVQENVLGNMESVMVEMIVLTALMKDKIFVVSGQNSGWTQCLLFLTLGMHIDLKYLITFGNWF